MSGFRRAHGVLDIYLRSVISGCALFLFLFTVPILAKWILIGRWKPQRIRIWSLAYVRFWVVKTLVRRNPIVLFTGSPLFNLYLRALGAKVGRGVVILSTHVPICTDLLSIGEGTVIRKDSFINGYQAHAGFHPRGPDHHREERGDQRGDGHRHRHLDGRRDPAGPRLLAALRAGRARRPTLAR